MSDDCMLDILFISNKKSPDRLFKKSKSDAKLALHNARK